MAKTTHSASFPLDATASFNPLIVKENLEKALSGFADLNSEGKRNLEALSSSAAITAKAAQALGAETASYYKSAFEAYVAQAKQVAGVQSFQAAIELQTAYSKSAFDAFSAHVAATSALVSSAVKEAARPLNERATAAAEKFAIAR